MARPAANQPAGMDRSELKRMLRLAQDEPVQAAFALDGDGKALLTLDRRRPGRVLEKALKDDAPDSKGHRWGTAAVDPDDPKLIKFVVNKAGGGMARKLVAALKGTGYSKVQIALEDGSAVEAHEEQDPTQGEDAGPQAAGLGAAGAGGIAASAGLDAGDGSRPDAPADAPAGNGPSAGPADPKDLTHDLTALVRRMLDVIRQNPSQQAALAKLATEAQASLKRGDRDQAAARMDVLRQAVDAASAGSAEAGGGTTGPGGVPMPPPPASDGTARPPAPPAQSNANRVIAKARQAWVETRTKIEGDVGKLHDAVASAAEGHHRQADITASVRSKLDTVLDALDHALAHKLDAVSQAGDAGQRAKLVQEAHTLLQRYQGHLASDPVIAALDRNPFMPLAIQKTMSATLAALSKSIK